MVRGRLRGLHVGWPASIEETDRRSWETVEVLGHPRRDPQNDNALDCDRARCCDAG